MNEYHQKYSKLLSDIFIPSEVIDQGYTILVDVGFTAHKNIQCLAIIIQRLGRRNRNFLF
jgi:hypothetical protein